MCWIVFEKCCFCWRNSWWSVCCCREISVNVGVVFFFPCTGCQRAALDVIWKVYARILNGCLCWLSLIVYSCSCYKSAFLLTDWQMSNTEWFLEGCSVIFLSIFLLTSWCSPLTLPYLSPPIPCTYCLLFTCFPATGVLRNAKYFVILSYL